MNPRPHIRRRLAAVGEVAARALSATGVVLALLVAGPAVAAGASPASVSATILDATTIDASGCAANVANVTALGTVMAAADYVTSADCVVSWTSNGSSSMLKVYQRDGYKTAMARDAWVQQTVPVEVPEFAVAVSASEVFIANRNGNIRHTTDGGTTWTSQTSGTGNHLWGIDAWDASNLYIVGEAGVILTTTNGGSTWTSRTSGVGTMLNGVAAGSATVAWAVGQFGVIRGTTNGGAGWTGQTSGTAADLYDADAAGTSTAWAVGAGGAIRATSNGGSTWTGQASGTAQDLYVVSAVDANVVWAAGANGTILRTTNGGGTWTAQTSGTSAGLEGLVAIDANTAWAMGSGGTVLRTTDAGATWQAQTTGATGDFMGGAAWDASTAWAVGESSPGVGTVYAVPGAPIPDYVSTGAAGDKDWASGTGMFGVCLRSLAGDATTNGTSWSPNATCPVGDGGQWHGVPATAAGAGSKIALTPGATGASTVRLRFGFRAAAAQATGVYNAPLVFEAIAPDA